MRPAGLVAEPAGHVLVLRRGGGPDPWTVAVARALPPEPGRGVVVVDPGAVRRAGDWPDVLSILDTMPPAARARLRLVLSGAGSGAPAPARLLADRLGADIVAPDGRVLLTRAGTLFVGAPPGAGAWRRFVPGTARATVVAIRHPAPAWEQYLPPTPLRSATGAVAEPVPAGLWVHAGDDDSRLADRLADPAFAVPPDPARVLVVVGGPAGAAFDEAELAEIVDSLPTEVRARLVTMPYARLVPAAPPAPVPPAPAPPAAVRPASAPPAAVRPAPVPPAPVPPAPGLPAVSTTPFTPTPPSGPAAPSAPAGVPAGAPAACAMPRAPLAAPAPPGLAGRTVPGGVVYDSPGAEPAPESVAPWRQPDHDLFTVFVRYDATRGSFRIGDERLDPLGLAELIAVRDDRGERPVLLACDEVPAGWVVQLVADYLQVATVAGPQRQGGWSGARPRRVDLAPSLGTDMGAAYPFDPARKAGLSVPAAPAALPEPNPAGIAAGGMDGAGLLLAEPADPGYGPVRDLFDAWRRSGRHPDRFAIAVARDPGPATPFRVAAWDVARALWDVRHRWASTERDLVLLADVPERAATLLATYLGTPVSLPQGPLWIDRARLLVGAPAVLAGGRVVPRFAAGGGWTRVEPRRRAGIVAGHPPMPPPTRPQPLDLGAGAPALLDERLDRVLAASRRMPAGRMFPDPARPGDPSVHRAVNRLPAHRGMYAVEIGADAGGFAAAGEQLSGADLGRLLAACTDRDDRAVLLVGDGDAQAVADALGAPVLAPPGPVYVSRDGVLVVSHPLRTCLPADAVAERPFVPAHAAGVRRATVPLPAVRTVAP